MMNYFQVHSSQFIMEFEDKHIAQHESERTQLEDKLSNIAMRSLTIIYTCLGLIVLNA